MSEYPYQTPIISSGSVTTKEELSDDTILIIKKGIEDIKHGRTTPMSELSKSNELIDTDR